MSPIISPSAIQLPKQGRWVNTTVVGDLSAYEHGYPFAKVFISNASKLLTTACIIHRIGSGSGDYIEKRWNQSNLSDGWQWIWYSADAPTTTQGTVDWNNIDYNYIQIVIPYSATDNITIIFDKIGIGLAPPVERAVDTVLGKSEDEDAYVTYKSNDAGHFVVFEGYWDTAEANDLALGEINCLDGASGTQLVREVMPMFNKTSSKELLLQHKISFVNTDYTTNVGLNLMRDLFSGAGSAKATHFAMGTGTTAMAPTNTAMETETFRGAINTIAVTSDKYVDYTSIVKSTECNGEALTESGIVSASSGGTLIHRKTHTAYNKEKEFNYKEEWRFEIEDDGI